MDEHARNPFATVQASYDFCKPENKALADAASRSFDSKGNRLTQHWIDFPGRVMQGATKAQQRQLVGAADYAEQPLTVQTARALLAPMIDSAVSKSEGRLDAKHSTRIDLLKTSVGSRETTVTSELRSFKVLRDEGGSAECNCRTTNASTTALSAAAIEGQRRLAATLRLWQGKLDTPTSALQHQHQHRTVKPRQRSQWPVGGVVARTWRGTALMW